jgi:hypothetical protein
VRQERLTSCCLRIVFVVVIAFLNIGWSGPTINHVAWRSVDFFPPDLARLVRRHHRRFDAGIQRGLSIPPAWRAGPPGKLLVAFEAQTDRCYDGLRKPIPLADLVEELGVLAVYALDANDPLAITHTDPREPRYSHAYQRYAESIRHRIRLVYYGQNHDLIYNRNLRSAINDVTERSRKLYPYVGEEFFREGVLRDWQTFDDRSVAFGVAAISLSRGMTDLANLAAYIWNGGGGYVPSPRPTPDGHNGPTVTVILGGGFRGEEISSSSRTSR